MIDRFAKCSFSPAMGGLGRAGTIAVCVLTARDVGPGTAVELVRAARPGAL